MSNEIIGICAKVKSINIVLKFMRSFISIFDYFNYTNLSDLCLNLNLI